MFYCCKKIVLFGRKNLKKKIFDRKVEKILNKIRIALNDS